LEDSIIDNETMRLYVESSFQRKSIDDGYTTIEQRPLLGAL
jgi:hypothetical protein